MEWTGTGRELTDYVLRGSMNVHVPVAVHGARCPREQESVSERHPLASVLFCDCFGPSVYV